MTPDEISYWSMVGTWVSGLATTAAVVISLYLSISTKKPKLKIKIELSEYGSAILQVINNSSIIATVDGVTLSTSKSLNKTQQYSSHHNLIKNPLMKKDIEAIYNEYTVLPDGHYKEFKIEFSSLQSSYKKLLPYDANGNLTRVIKMPPAHIIVHLVGGHSFKAKLPAVFLKRYRDDDCMRLQLALQDVINNPHLHSRYANENELNERQQERLEWYMKSKKNALYLIL